MRLPLTLTLSPVLTGRGDLPNEMLEWDGDGAAHPLLPRLDAGRCRQADEGRPHGSSNVEIAEPGGKNG
ncbi:hypothetical protein CO659_05785 [Rhizobium sp. S9]|nr:hypothetical protein CO659_05785 [Rhizobium sp. S9]